MTKRSSQQPDPVPPQAEPQREGPTGKLGLLVGLLRAEGGANIATLSEVTGWQAHSVRGAIAGSLKKKWGFTIISEKSEAGRIYRIDEPAE